MFFAKLLLNGQQRDCIGKPKLVPSRLTQNHGVRDTFRFLMSKDKSQVDSFKSDDMHKLINQRPGVVCPPRRREAGGMATTRLLQITQSYILHF